MFEALLVFPLFTRLFNHHFFLLLSKLLFENQLQLRLLLKNDFLLQRKQLLSLKASLDHFGNQLVDLDGLLKHAEVSECLHKYFDLTFVRHF